MDDRSLKPSLCAIEQEDIWEFHKTFISLVMCSLNSFE